MTTNIFRFKLGISIWMILLVLLSACTSYEDEVYFPSSSEKYLTYKLTPKPTEQIQTRSDSSDQGCISISLGEFEKSNNSTTRGKGVMGDEQEQAILDVWVMQFDGTDPEAKLEVMEYIAEIGDDYIIETKQPTGKVDPDKEHTVFFLVNTHNSSLFKNTLIGTYKLGSMLELATKVYPSIGDLTSQGKYLPMSAMYRGKPQSTLTEIQLTRQVAKINFKYKLALPEGHDFELKAIQLQECATRIRYSSNTTIFPTPTSSYFIDYDMTSLSPNTEITWYVPENLQGQVSGISKPHQKGGNSAPSHATNIYMFGYYKRPKGEEVESYPIIYRIYLGENNTSSFNLKRNHSYNIVATISEASVSDKRVYKPNIALAHFAETNLKDLNEFVQPDDATYPVGAAWTYGRNKPVDMSISNYSVMSSFGSADFWKDSVWRYYKLTPPFTTWTKLVMHVAEMAPDSYIGTNLDYSGNKTGDPCPNGYHLPSAEEYLAISNTAQNDVYQSFGGIRGVFSNIVSSQNGFTCSLSFLQSGVTNYITAYRWKVIKKDNISQLEVRARYLGKAGNKYNIAQLGTNEFWAKNDHTDVVRYFPYSLRSEFGTTKNLTTSRGVWYWTTTPKISGKDITGFVYYRGNVDDNYYTYQTMNIRCIKN